LKNGLDRRGHFRLGAFSLSFLPDGKLTAYEEFMHPNEVKVWDVQTGKQLSTFDYSSYVILPFITLSHNGALFAGVSLAKNKIVIWHAQSGKILQELKISCRVNTLALQFSPDDKMLVAGCKNGDILTWQAKLPEKK